MTDLQPVPFDSDLAAYQHQAEVLLEDWRAGGKDAFRIFHTKHPRFLDEKIPWLPKKISDDEIRDAGLNIDDARLAIARSYDFADWAALTQYAEAVRRPGSPVATFERAVEAVIDGDAPTLRALVREHPDLIRARSTRVTHFDPPMHDATLLHYIAANGVEGYRQRTPTNAVEIARILLEAGAEPDALADMYGGRCTTMSMLVSSVHPAKAGVQPALVDVLVDYGASVEASGEGAWTSPLLTALVFGYKDAAEALVRRGARIDTVAKAAGLGRVEDVRRLLEGSTSADRHVALAVGAQHGHVEIVRALLDAGEDPNRYNPKGTHAHSTPLHQAALAGHEDVVRLLVERGATLDIKDTVHHGTALGWAEYGGRKRIAEYLRSAATGA